MKYVLLSCLLMFGLSASSQEITPESLAQAQLDAYNAGDLEAFLVPYSDTVKIYNFPKVLNMKGKENMRMAYGNMFANMPDLHCTLVNRMVSGNTVIDHESVVFRKDQPSVEVFAMYKIANDKIVEVYFIRPEQVKQ